ncbi:MAG: O-methyltransferase [Chitinophagales bacterium]|nr:O-methyltransferase [Chitinophagales bacterium]
MKNILRPIHDYCERLSTPPSQVLYELERETHLKTLAPQMLSGKLQGQLLQLISQLQQPQRILEIGTFTGYASICLAQGLAEEGILHTIEANPELEYIIRKYIAKAGLEKKINLHIGNAKNIIPGLKEQFDLIFLDAGKQHYAFYYDLVFDMVKPGGLILADNVLWSGKVTDAELVKKDADTRLLHEFNVKVQQDKRVENVLLPLRDGLLVVRKRE